MRVLAFHLHGPTAAWGGIGYGNHRPTLPHPSRSNLLGLVAAALGIDRRDDARQAELERALGVAVRVHREGHAFVDYHTVQSQETRRGSRWLTRKDELDAPRHELKTNLTSREYVADAWYTAACWKRAEEGPSLETIADALRTPRHALYLGRRSCPLALDLNPRVVEADTLAAAFAALDLATDLTALGLRVPEMGGSVFSDPIDPPGLLGFQPTRTVEQRDVPLGWSRRAFTTRQVLCGRLGVG